MAGVRKSIWFLVVCAVAAFVFALGCSSTRPTPVHSDVAEHIAHIEHSIPPLVRVQGEDTHAELAERMRAANVPALSVAVFDHYQLQWAHAWGFTDVAHHVRATETTLFQAGSISKTGNALAVLEAIADGALLLDAPINDQLASWKLPDNELTTHAPVTLRQLIGHIAGTTGHGFPGYAPGTPLPTIQQVLDGAPPANTPAVRVDLAPGTKFRYSGGGITITQLALTERLHQPYPAILAARVLQPLGMTHSTYEQPLPASREAETATGYRSDGSEIDGKHHVYPEMAAAGLWTTPSDLARLFAEIALARTGRSKLISKTIALEMTTRTAEIPDAGALGTFLTEKADTAMFFHDGADAGFQSLALASLDGGFGVVIMTNSDNGHQIFDELFAAIAAEYHWPTLERPVVRVALDSTQRAAFTGQYATPSGDLVAGTIADHNGKLELRFPFGLPHELVPTATDTVVDRESGDILHANDKHDLEIIQDHKTVGIYRRLGSETPLLFALEAGQTDGAATTMRARNPTKVDHDRLIEYGYDVMQERPAGAVTLFQFIADIFPASANAEDSLGDAYLAAKNAPHAIAAYERARDLVDADPFIPTAAGKAALRRHGEQQIANIRGK